MGIFVVTESALKFTAGGTALNQQFPTPVTPKGSTTAQPGKKARCARIRNTHATQFAYITQTGVAATTTVYRYMVAPLEEIVIILNDSSQYLSIIADGASTILSIQFGDVYPSR